VGIAIFAGLSTAKPVTTIFPFAPWPCRQLLDWRSRKTPMQRITLFMRATPSRIGRRIARIVAIAAASLPEVGA
jgi:hypothetical protein